MQPGMNPNRFGPLYKNHHWMRTADVQMALAQLGRPMIPDLPTLGMVCLKCEFVWLPHMESRDIKWCKGVKA